MDLKSRVSLFLTHVREGWPLMPMRTRVLSIGFFAVSVLLGIAWRECLFLGCPDVHVLNAHRPHVSAALLDRNGKRLAELAPVEQELVGLLTLPKYIPDAFVAIEDRRFRSHRGIDLRRVVGALRANFHAGRIDQGSSTITMQLARNVFPDRLPSSERTLSRKILEVRVAQQIEDVFSKDEILEMYLNHIYFGSGATGIQAAARHYFGVDAKLLTLPQAALLAGLPKAPSHYDPRHNPKDSRERRDLVLSLMAKQHRITDEQAKQAQATDLGVAKLSRTATGTGNEGTGYFVQEVRRQLEDLLGDQIHEEPLRITTTLDLGAQAAAEEELERQLRTIEDGKLGAFKAPKFGTSGEAGADKTPYLQGAFVAMEVETGDVLAWVGGRSFEDSRFDRVKSARRQAGSAFKPFVYAAAIEAGSSLSRMLSDEPLRVQLDRTHVWEPQNFDRTFQGSVSMRDALVRSMNVPTVRLASEVGVANVAALALKAGIAPPIPEEPSMALGTIALSPLEITSAYTAFADRGSAVKPRILLDVKRADGTVLWQAPPVERVPVIEESTAYILTDALHEALLRGTGATVSAAGFVGPAAGKTGTTQDGADAWFVGYTPDVVAASWIGFDETATIVPRATGGVLAAPVWARVMLRLYKQRPMPKARPMPADVVEVMIDPTTGFPLPEGCNLASGTPRREIFRRSLAPGSVCPVSDSAQTLAASLPQEPSDDEAHMDPGYIRPVQIVAPGESPTGANEPAHSYAPTRPTAAPPANLEGVPPSIPAGGVSVTRSAPAPAASPRRVKIATPDDAPPPASEPSTQETLTPAASPSPEPPQ